VRYPFEYGAWEQAEPAPYREPVYPPDGAAVAAWIQARELAAPAQA
jgi:hypothetical protein